MINNAADLIDSLIKYWRPQMDSNPTTHPGVIGDMYEGLTREIINKTFPGQLNDIRIAAGFVCDKKGQKSSQIDCMVVQGEGEQIPLTKHFNYRIDQVIATIEVKKRLTSQSLDDAFKKVVSLSNLDVATPTSLSPYVASRFSSITGMTPPKIDSVRGVEPYDTIIKQMIFESVLPARIILGYHGYSTEIGLRNATLERLKELSDNGLLNPLRLPSLIATEKAAVVKLNGYPFSSPLRKDKAWPFIASVSKPRMSMLLLEQIWSRLLSRGAIDVSAFGLDLDMQVLHALAFLHVDNSTGKWTVEMLPFDPPDSPAMVSWEPCEISGEEFTALNLIEQYGKIQVKDCSQSIIDSLIRKMLIAESSEDPGAYVFATQHLAIGILPDGRTFAGENASGRFTNWLSETIRNIGNN